MRLKALILVPSQFEDDEIKFDMATFILNMENNCKMELNLISVNCPSLFSMADVISGYFNEVISRKTTDLNILTATYLGMIDLLLRDYPQGFPIRQDILDIIHQEPEFRHIKSHSGYYFQFEMKEWLGVEKAVKEQMQLND